MQACTFFGHRECPGTVVPQLREAVVDLIENHGVTMFYVGHQGHFDFMVRQVLRELKPMYPQMEYAVVLAYLPEKPREYEDYSDTMLPEGIEAVHPKFAISWRNNWMLKQSSYVVSYITHTWGGAYQYTKKAIRSGKTVVNLSSFPADGKGP